MISYTTFQIYLQVKRAESNGPDHSQRSHNHAQPVGLSATKVPVLFEIPDVPAQYHSLNVISFHQSTEYNQLANRSIDKST